MFFNHQKTGDESSATRGLKQQTLGAVFLVETCTVKGGF
jgi:hypothetical protein